MLTISVLVCMDKTLMEELRFHFQDMLLMQTVLLSRQLLMRSHMVLTIGLTLLPRARPRQANLGASTLHDTIATRRTSPRKRIAQLKNANQQAKSVVFSDTVASAARTS